MAQRQSVGSEKQRGQVPSFVSCYNHFTSLWPQVVPPFDSCSIVSFSFTTVFYILPFLSSPYSMLRLKLNFGTEQSSWGQNCKSEPEAKNSSLEPPFQDKDPIVMQTFSAMRLDRLVSRLCHGSKCGTNGALYVRAPTLESDGLGSNHIFINY